MKPLRIDEAARQELLHEAAYYEAARVGLGKRFADHVAEIFAWIERDPESGKPDAEGCRRHRVSGFPFSVVREEPAEIVVYAIRPDARDPNTWKARPK